MNNCLKLFSSREYLLLFPNAITAMFHNLEVFMLSRFQKMKCLCQMLMQTRIFLSSIVTKTVTLSQMPVGTVWVLGVLKQLSMEPSSS